jgi:predicted ArsR family transcriptional regulator
MKARKVDFLAQMDRIHASVGYTENDPGFTVHEYAERYRLTNHAAQGRLQRMVSSGLLVMGWKRSERGRRERTYRPMEV